MGQLDRLGEHLLQTCSSAHDTLTLCAPFVKAYVLERVLGATADSVSVELFTRWRPDEVAAGVSDTAVLSIAKGRGASVLLCDRLHAKFVKFDDRALIGSANLTSTALGWSAVPNLELLTEVPADTPQLVELEERLRRESIVATTELADEVDRIAALLPRFELAIGLEHEQMPRISEGPWYPTLREPRDLFVAYSVGIGRMSRASAAAASADLSALQLPAGLERPEFEAVVGSRLMQTSAVRTVDAFLTEPRRFGAIRDLLGYHLALDRDSADFAWQTIMRWLLEFLPQRYERRVANWSEVFSRRGSPEDASA